MDGGTSILSFLGARPFCWGALAVSFREGVLTLASSTFAKPKIWTFTKKHIPKLKFGRQKERMVKSDVVLKKSPISYWFLVEYGALEVWMTNILWLLNVFWLVVATHPKNIIESNWKSSPNRGENKKYLKPPPSIGRNFIPIFLYPKPTGWTTPLNPTSFNFASAAWISSAEASSVKSHPFVLVEIKTWEVDGWWF